MQAVHDHFSFAKRDSLKTIVFEESEIFLGIPEDGINQDGWQITPTFYPVVRIYLMVPGTGSTCMWHCAKRWPSWIWTELMHGLKQTWNYRCVYVNMYKKLYLTTHSMYPTLTHPDYIHILVLVGKSSGAVKIVSYSSFYTCIDC